MDRAPAQLRLEAFHGAHRNKDGGRLHGNIKYTSLALRAMHERAVEEGKSAHFYSDLCTEMSSFGA